MACVKDLMGLKSLTCMELQAGRGGLYHPISWPNFAQMPDMREWLVGNDVLLMTGFGLKNTPETLCDIVRQAVSCDSACLIVYLNPDYIPRLPEKMIAEANALNFSVFTIPWETRYADIIRDISGILLMERYQAETLHSLLEELLTGKGIPSEPLREFVKNHRLFGNHAVAAVTFDENCRTATLEQSTNQFVSALTSAYPGTMNTKSRDRTIFLINAEENTSQDILATGKKICDEIRSRWPGTDVFFGLGRIYSDPFDLHCSLDEAVKAIHQATSECPAVAFEDLGLFQLLMDIPDQERIRTYSLSILKPLLDYDLINKKNFRHTLEVYLESNCSTALAARKLYIHRNTLLYQLERIQELLGVSLDDSKNRLAVSNALTLYRYCQH